MENWGIYFIKIRCTFSHFWLIRHSLIPNYISMTGREFLRLRVICLFSVPLEILQNKHESQRASAEKVLLLVAEP